MKQKNLVLIAVAVGCGLVAAFLTSQIGAGPARVEQVEIPVAAKDLEVGKKLSKEDIANLVEMKKVPRDALPAAYASTREELSDKRLIRTIRKGEPFNPQDLTTNAPISPPAGYNMMSYPSTPEKSAAGFAGPGSRVDIICTIRERKSGKIEVFPLLLDMLVLAIDANVQGVQQGAHANLSMVSLAVKSKQASLLHKAIGRGADLRLVLRNPESPATWDNIKTEEEIDAILSDEPDATASGEGGKGGGNTVKVPVPTEDLGAGTQLTPEVLASKFKTMDIQAPAPAQFVLDLKEHAGRYLLKDLYADQFVPRTALGEKSQPKPAPTGEAGPVEKTQPTLPGTKPLTVPVRQAVYWDATVQTSNGVKKFRYEVLENKAGKEYRYLGEVKEDGSVKPTRVPNQVTPPAPPAEEPKPETKPETEGGRDI